MPDKYFVEMVCDRIAASKIYYGDNYTDNAPLNYFLGKKGKILINKDTEKELEYVLRMLADKGEKRVFRYLRKKYGKRAQGKSIILLADWHADRRYMANKKLGIYIHIPFCKSKCIYCDFFLHRQKSMSENSILRHYAPR